MPDASQYINIATITADKITVLGCREAEFDDYWDAAIFEADKDWLEPVEPADLAGVSSYLEDNGLDKMQDWGGDMVSPLLLIDEGGKESHWYLNEKLGLCKAAPPHRYVSDEDMRSVLLRAQAKGWTGTIAWASFRFH